MCLDSSPFENNNQVVWPAATQHIVYSPSPKNADLLEANTPKSFHLDNFSNELSKRAKTQINEDLEDVTGNLELQNSFETRNDRSGNSSPIVDHTRPEESFEDAKNASRSSFELLENNDVPDKPTMDKERNHNMGSDDPLMPYVKYESEDDCNLDLSQKDSDILKNEIEDDVNLITDHILHTMLCELDKDRGINRALNNGDAPEEMPSFLTRGIRTDALSIAQYLKELFDKIKEEKETFLDSLSTPLNRDPLEILGHLQDIEEGTNESESENMPFQQSVLPVDLYLENEKRRRINKMSDEERLSELQKLESKKLEKAQKLQNDGILYDSEDFDDDDSIMAEWENIHNKVIFDWVNEILDSYRPYGLKGPPLTWSTNLRTLTYKYSEPERIEEVLYEVQEKIMAWSENEAGTLSDSDTILNAPPEIRHIMTEKQFLNQVREERLANLLSTEINDSEPLWLDYEYEDTQVKLDIADMVLQELWFETIKEWRNLENRFNPEFIDEIIDDLFSEPKENLDDNPIILQNEKSSGNIPIKPVVAKSEALNKSL